MPGSYDTVQGITEYLTDLDGLNRLIRDRQAAGYQRKERLHDFVVMGRWHTDSCGNFGRCKFELNYKPTDIPAALPKVVESKALYAMLDGLSISTAMESSGVPPTHVLCPECGVGWTLETAHDTRVRKEDRVVPLHPGRSIADRERDFDNETEGLLRFGPEPGVRNPKFIDLTPHPEYKRPINEKGWRYHHPPLAREVVKQDYVAEEGDTCSMTVFVFEHQRCADIRKARLEREFFTEVFDKAGFTNLVMNEIPNEYCPCEVCGPWFIARLPAGDLKIGWRKRVINIDWSALKRSPREPALSDLFEAEDVTKGSDHIHAWGKEKAITYLTKLREAL